MRWESLFADMEAQLAAVEAAEARLAVAELTRAEWSRVELVDRLRAGVGSTVRLRLGADAEVAGELIDAAPQWLLVADGPVRRALVPVRAVTAVAGLSLHSAPPAGVVERRLGLGHALRALARDRVQVRAVIPGGELVGRLDRVGADHVDMADPTGGTGWTVALASLLAVRSG